MDINDRPEGIVQTSVRDDLIRYIEDVLCAGPDFPMGRYEDKAHSLEQMFGMLDVAMPISFAILDPDMRYVFINAQTYLMHGFDRNELKVGDPLSRAHELMVQKGAIDEGLITVSEISPEILSHIPTGQSKSSVIALRNGTFKRLTRVRLANGYTVSIAEDVTELMEAQNLLQDALILGLSGYWLYDFDTKSYEISESLTRMLRDEQIERAKTHGPLVMVHPDDRQPFRDALIGMRETKDSFRITTRAAFNSDIHFRSTGRIIRSPDGQAQKLQCFVQDVTSQRRKALELETAKDEAVAASHTKSQFLANMSHEIRTPMNGVLGMAELLAGSALDDRQREFVNVITRSATSLLTVINDILDFSKIEAGALDLEHHPFTLPDIVTEVTTLLAPNASEKGLELVVRYPEGQAKSFLGDGTRIRQILTNLIGNALKFTEKGHVLIDVSAIPDPSSNAQLTVSVTDTGIGIEPDKIDSVFDKFTQADNSTTRIYGGTGLGLSISKRLAEMMGGSLSIASIYGQGSTFTLTLPLQLDKTAKPIVRNTSPMRGKRALIVDDVDVNRRLLSEQLSGWGMTTLAVADGVKAMAALTMRQDANDGAAPFDFIIMDFLMPGMNGREVAAMIDANPDLDLPILMLSSCDASFSPQEDNQNGITSYLVKPVREQALFDAILSMLYPGSSEAVKPPASPSPRLEKLSAVEIARTRAGEPIHILVAEDFALNQDVVRLMLADTRYTPVIVENGELAIDAYRERPELYAAVLMDVSMPVMDGYMATSEIRATEKSMRLAHTPIIALTGHALTHERQKCIEAGMDDYLTKPVKQVELIGALDRWTGNETRIAVA